MHLQYRIKLASGSDTDTPGAESADRAEADPVQARPGLLAELAGRIRDAGIDIRLVSGRGIETGGILILAVNDAHAAHSARGADGDHQPHGQGSSHGAHDSRGEPAVQQSAYTSTAEASDDEKLKALLDEHGYRYERFVPTMDVLDDRLGALAEWAEGVAREGRLIDTIALGTPESHGTEGEQIPLQATTIAFGAASRR